MPEISRHLRPLFLVGVGFAIGFQCSEWAHSYQDEVSRTTYHDVTVLARHDSRNFTVRIPGTEREVYEWATCIPVDWEPWQRMESVRYSQQIGCKDVTIRGDYNFYNDGSGHRILYPEGELTQNVR